MKINENGILKMKEYELLILYFPGYWLHLHTNSFGNTKYLRNIRGNV